MNPLYPDLQLLAMEGTYTNTNDDDSILTIDKLVEVYRDLEALLPVQLYRAHRYVPRTKDDEPFFASVPEFDMQAGNTTGRYILYVHPDNLSLLRFKVKGIFRLVEWQPEEAK